MREKDDGGHTLTEAQLESVIVAAYKRGFDWAVENGTDKVYLRTYLAKAAHDFADKMLSSRKEKT
jgi:hypothetical protein